jgi:hypothetical protein
MSVKELHALTGKLIKQRRGNAEVAFDTSSIMESEDPSVCIHDVERGKYKRVQGCDDSGPVGPKFPFLVLSGGLAAASRRVHRAEGTAVI